MVKKREASAVMTSLALHALILAALFMVQYAVAQQIEEIEIETAMVERERVPEELLRELEQATDIAVSPNSVSGGVVTNSELGGEQFSQRAQQEIEQVEALQEPDYQVAIGPPLPSFQDGMEQLPDGQVNGETSAAVEGYGPAMSRLTRELSAMLRDQKLLVVWLFDESDSMKNDQKEIRDEFHKVYEELRIIQNQDKRKRRGNEPLLTAIHSYGSQVNELTAGATGEENKIKAAIDKIGVDTTGQENMCGAIAKIVDQYSTIATRGERRLVLIVVSDESGDDGEAFDLTLAKVKKARAPVYILGRESVFGYPYAHIRWIDPKHGLPHWLQIRRGPETAFPEALQYDGLHGRWDAQSAGFGPYEQVRLAKESGGVFFALPSDEDNLVTVQRGEDRRYASDFKDFFEAMREYTPLWESRRSYQEERDKSEFRRTLWEVIVKLDPHSDPELHIKEHWYSGDHEEFRKEGKLYFGRAIRAMQMLNEAVATLEGIRPLREEEPSQRWRANYDLAYAQVLAYRVRLFQFLLAMDQHVKDFPEPKDPKNNRWNLRRTRRMLQPDDEQIDKTKVDVAKLEEQRLLAENEFNKVVYRHPGTPWAYRAKYELSQGFGMEFVDVFRDPRYDDPDLKLPKQ